MNSKDLLSQAIEAHRQGNLEAAEASYMQVLEADGRDPGVLSLLGLLKLQKEEASNAEALYSEAVSLEPDCGDHHFGLGDALITLGKTEEALAAYREGLRFSPDDAARICLLGHLLAESEEFEEAEKLYMTALGIGDEAAKAESRKGLGVLYLRYAEAAFAEGEEGKAGKFCHQALNFDPTLDAVSELLESIDGGAKKREDLFKRLGKAEPDEKFDVSPLSKLFLTSLTPGYLSVIAPTAMANLSMLLMEAGRGEEIADLFFRQDTSFLLLKQLEALIAADVKESIFPHIKDKIEARVPDAVGDWILEGRLYKGFELARQYRRIKGSDVTNFAFMEELDSLLSAAAFEELFNAIPEEITRTLELWIDKPISHPTEGVNSFFNRRYFSALDLRRIRFILRRNLALNPEDQSPPFMNSFLSRLPMRDHTAGLIQSLGDAWRALWDSHRRVRQKIIEAAEIRSGDVKILSLLKPGENYGEPESGGAANITMENVIENPLLLQKVVVLFFYGRSGSSLVDGLLNDHSKILSMPFFMIDSFFMRALSIGDMDIYGNDFERLSEKIAETFSLIEADPDNPIGEDAYKRTLRRSLANAVKNGASMDEATIMRCLYATYNYLVGKQLCCDDPVILWHVHAPHDSKNIKMYCSDNFRHSYFLTSIRYPLKTLNSHFNHYLNQRRDFDFPELPVFLIDTLLMGDLLDDELDDPKTTIGMRFEDVHERTEETMRSLAQWLEIGWEPTLLKSTVFGKPLMFTSGKGSKITDTDPARARDLSTPYLSWLDRWKLKYMLRKNLMLWEYQEGAEQGERSFAAHYFFNKVASNIPFRMHWPALREDVMLRIRHHLGLWRETRRLFRFSSFDQANR